MFEKRKKIKTQNLCLVKLTTITKYISNYVQGTEIHFSEKARYALAYRTDSLEVAVFPAYVDCFTGTIYRDKFDASEGEECFLKATAILTNKDYITFEEATYILRKLNPTYLPEVTNEHSLKRKLVKNAKPEE
ncbi:unknown [Mycoplasma sp. CAG:956]|nr:unknown [Mycoplasma sp. CAG:956]